MYGLPCSLSDPCPYSNEAEMMVGRNGQFASKTAGIFQGHGTVGTNLTLLTCSTGGTK